jgi:hypothetical protein
MRFATTPPGPALSFPQASAGRKIALVDVGNGFLTAFFRARRAPFSSFVRSRRKIFFTEGGLTMKKLVAVAVVALIGLTGCNQSTPGGPGATKADRGPSLTQGENTFDLVPPRLETDIKQGETKTVTIGISRGKNFGQDVKLDFGKAPQGVKITPKATELKASEKEMPVTIEAEKDAALGEHTITVTGTPAAEGSKATATFKIQVEKAG